MSEKPIVNICSWCENLNSPDNAKFAVGVDPKIKDELKIVHQQIKNHTNDIRFTHSICIPHTIQMYKGEGFPDDEIKSIVQKIETQNPSPCLITDEQTRQAYMKGLFTTEMIKQAQQAQQTENYKLTERFKKLAGI